MSAPRSRSLNLSLLALSLGAAVDQAAASDAKIVIMDLEHPESFRVVQSDDPAIAEFFEQGEARDQERRNRVLAGLNKGFVTPILPSVRRSPVPTRAPAALKAKRKISPTKVVKPSTPKRKPPLRRKRKP
ncbi:MAG: hypothetical protein WC866_02730 [Patescibacteria group bacterium]|jgi:hypothetical protein